MELKAGVRLGSYEIQSALGAGGMGEVYRALDTRLNRPVAIKFLSPHVSDLSARRRFQEEAQMASALNHPHILTVHEAGELDDRQFLVTEFIDGGTLKQWAQAEKRSWRQVVDLMVGVADGLAAAHAVGILHRDIKPDNILVTRSGYAKLADFGLAKLDELAASESITRGPGHEPTRQGVIVGTIGYMSPEQASGKPLDARSDIFSLGVVLYELLEGRRPFEGKTDLEVLQTIIHQTPAPLSPDLPVGLRMTVEKAIEKDPADRYQTMRDLVVDLRRMARQKATEFVTAPSGVAAAIGARRWRRPLVIVGAAIVLGLAGALALGRLPRTSAIAENPLEAARFTRLTDFEGTEMDAAISPDGRFVAFLSDRDGPLDVWLSQVNSGAFRNLTQGKDPGLPAPARAPGFTMDGSQIWLGGGARRRLQLMPLMGGAPRAFLNDLVVNIAWSPDGSRLAYHTRDPGDPLFVADRDGTNPRQIFVAANAGVHNHYPAWSPDGRWIYFASGTPATREMDLWRIAAAGGTPERLTQHNNEVAYATPIDQRTVLYVARDSDGAGPWLWAFDVERRATRRVSLGVEKYTSVSASADGTRLVATVANPSSSLWTVPILDRPAQMIDVKPFPLSTANATGPRFSGSTLFYASSGGAGNALWRYRDGEAVEIWRGADAVTLEPPAISPDGSRLAIALRRSGKLRMHVLSADGAELQPLTDAINAQGAACWSPDGKSILTGGSDAQGSGLFKVPIDGGAPVRLAAGQALDPVWAPDGSLIVYTGTNVSVLAPLLAVRPDGTPVSLPPIQVRREGKRARFLPDGSGLVYMQGTVLAQDFWLLDLATQKTRQLTRLNQPAAMWSFDIGPDGQQIVFDRIRDNSDIVLIDLAARKQP